MLIGDVGGGFLLFYFARTRTRDNCGRPWREGLREMPFDFDFEGPKVIMDFYGKGGT
jgi:hypothetical protein